MVQPVPAARPHADVLPDAGAGMPAAIPDAEMALWRSWRRDRCEQAHQELAALHGDYARIMAATYYSRRMHNEIEFAEYAQFAHVGLLESIERFDPECGVRFRTFAARRMHGAILDGIERLTEKQQQIAEMQRLRALRRQSLLADGENGRPAPAPRTPEQALKFISEVGLGLAISWLLEGTGMVDNGEASENLSFYQSIELRQLRERVVELVKALPPQQSRVIAGHYLQDLAFEEIATMLGLSKGRISQIHKQGLLALRAALQSPRPPPMNC
jgi:RNA polymerase sigma factor for flagellar operon FliA